MAARHLAFYNYSLEVYYPKRTENTLLQNLTTQCQNMNTQLLSTCPTLTQVENDYSLVVDALFGFSFKPPVRELFVPIMEILKQTKIPIVR